MDEILKPGHSHDSSRCIYRPTQRRSHKKSREGCRICKKRRIKCDETKPSCKNCLRASLGCDYNTSANSALSISNEVNAPKKRGRPVKKWAVSPKISEANSPTPSSSSSNCPHFLNVDDFQLFYHYLTHASLTVGDDVLWRDKVPRLAFEYPFILRLILAISAMHLSRLRVEESSRYEELAEAHFSVALPEVTGILPQISQNNCSALYVATVLVCDYTFAKTPTKGNLLVIAEGTEVAWWNLFRGVRFVIETMGLPAIFSGHLGPFPPENLTEPPIPVGEGGGYISWEGALDNLIVLTSNYESPAFEGFEVIRQALVDCFRDVYGTAEAPESRTHGKMHVVMRWLWFIEDDFISQVKVMSPPALVLLAHFAVLLQTLECFWFMQGWANHVMEGILEYLDPDFNIWISWPHEQIEGCGFDD